MKKFIIVGAVTLGLAGVIGACTNTEEKPVQKVAEVPASTPAPKEEPKPAQPSPDRPTGDKGVTEENYNKIVQGDYTGAGGMGKTEVFDMLGNADTFTTSKVNNDTIESASWNTKDYKVMIMITFMNGKVSSKTITKL
ncbi:hypothetical protein HWB81_gp08 [Bacillus phage Wes44]|uniref:Lipoprotein n=1 Tax=Bacillus phage Wes44 TaxID=2283012 RepID=A0A346FK12_9CAUD|nr:hypothetical protein HWB81_gp08 [Bacillus phage Wes44]AXN58317.1 hypothetical protein Wes44_8 [Bacillus phage Wes44]